MMKRFRKKLNNRGSSFVMVIVTMAFLSVLATSILVAAAFSYRLKVFNMNSRNNFYYVENALDEIYAGVGSIAVEHLKQAYYDTIEVLVYYDMDSKEYVTMKGVDANKLMKKTFLKYMQQDNSLKLDNISDTLAGFVSDLSTYRKQDSTDVSVKGTYTNSDGEDITLSLDCSNINVEMGTEGMIIRNVTVKRVKKYKVGANGDDYIQSITTDIVIGEPGYNVRFGDIDADNKTLYDFSMIADMGIEFLGAGSQINVSGNIYGAADFYNKDYDGTDKDGIKTTNTFSGADTDVCAYETGEDRFKACDGLQEHSMNSGLYVSGANAILQSEMMIIPGTLGVFNGGQIVVSTNATAFDENGVNRVKPCELWVDNIVLGGYTPIAGASRADLYANAYVYDDLELNADASLLKMEGAYYGYNWSQDKDTRTFLSPAAKNYQNSEGENANDHYNSSSIILNGQDTTLDFGKLDKMYIAGRSYVELSKQTVKSETNLSDTETVETKTYQYDKDIQDYITGESLSVKSNQLAYMPLRTWVTDADGKLYATVPANVSEPYEGFFKDLKETPVIKQEVSGNVYYFFDLKDFTDAANNLHKVDKETFIMAYTACFNRDTNTGEYDYSGAKYLKDITDYQRFQVASITLPTSDVHSETGDVTMARYMYSNGALTAKDGSKFSIKASEKAQQVFSSLDKVFDENASFTGDIGFKMVTTELTSDYNMVKSILAISPSRKGDVNKKVTDAANANVHFSPIEEYINMKAVHNLSIENGELLPNGYKVWVGKGDIEIDESDGIGKGIVISKGDVTFASTMKTFSGLIIAGGKIVVDHTMNFFADPAIVRETLRQCKQLTASTSAAKNVPNCIKGYGEAEAGNSGPGADPVDPDPQDVYWTDDTDPLDRFISEVSYMDVVSFANWKKNVE